MSSNRLRRVYSTSRWRNQIRPAVIQRAGGQCQWLSWNSETRTWDRCTVVDKAYGGTESLTVDHDNQSADPFDTRFLVALCRKHHGMKDGPRANRGRTW